LSRDALCGISRANQRGIFMDYGKTGAPKVRKNSPKHNEHNAKGTAKNPFSVKETKAELLARMKAAAEAKKAK
jgi:hypothetical protein